MLSKEKFLAIKELENPVKIKTVGQTPLWVKRSVLLQCTEFKTSGGPLVWRNLEMLVNEEDESKSLILDKHLMEKMGYSVMAMLEGVGEKSVWGGKEEREQNTPICNSLAFCDNKLFEEEVDIKHDKEEYLHRN